MKKELNTLNGIDYQQSKNRVREREDYEKLFQNPDIDNSDSIDGIKSR
jgi:hypothetical protein